MATKSIIMSAIAVIALSGCERPDVWEKPGVEQAQFHRDNLECAVMARQVVGDSFAMGSLLFIAMAQAAHDKAMKSADRECLMGKGYTLVQSK